MRNILSDKMHGKDEKKEAFQNTRKFKIQIHEVFNTALCYYRTWLYSKTRCAYIFNPLSKSFIILFNIDLI